MEANATTSRPLRFDEDPFHDNLHRLDIGIHCPKCKKECIFEWTVLKTGERSIRQGCSVHGYIRTTPTVPAYIERIKSESLLQYINNNTLDKCKGCNKLDVFKLVEQGLSDICKYK